MCVLYICPIFYFSLNESALEYEEIMLFKLILNFNYKTQICYNTY